MHLLHIGLQPTQIHMDNIETIHADLVESGILVGPEIKSTPITGGVSSDIFLVEDGVRKIVVKQALSQLRVADEWLVDTGRNQTEQEFICRVAMFLPLAVPKIIHSNPELHYFAMEYLQGYANWKEVLLDGNPNPDTGKLVGSILGSLHLQTWQKPDLSAEFNHGAYFHALRTEPYLLTCANRHPELRQLIQTEAQRLDKTRLCLIHGDYSPKNIMIKGSRVVILDCEVACYGEPAFDLAFLLNHILLKALLHRDNALGFIDLAEVIRQSYLSLMLDTDPGIELRTGRLLLMLMLARIDGKSPVEYLQDQTSKQFVRDFVYEQLIGQTFDLGQIYQQWQHSIASCQNHLPT